MGFGIWLKHQWKFFQNFSVGFQIFQRCLSQIPNPTSPQRDVCYRIKFAIMRKNDTFVAKIANTQLTKVLWPFWLSPKGCQLLPPWGKPKSPKNVILWKKHLEGGVPMWDSLSPKARRNTKQILHETIFVFEVPLCHPGVFDHFGPIWTPMDHFRQKWIVCPKWTK